MHGQQNIKYDSLLFSSSWNIVYFGQEYNILNKYKTLLSSATVHSWILVRFASQLNLRVLFCADNFG
jgi:hypothetical protein